MLEEGLINESLWSGDQETIKQVRLQLLDNLISINGIKNIVATLINFENNIITISLDDNSEMSFNKKDTSSIKLHFDNF